MAWQRDPERPDPAEPSRQKVRETLIERQIREAMEDGRFDDLPHQGERLPLEDDALAGEWASAYRMLKSAGVAPAWIEADKQARALLDERDRLLARAPGLSPLGLRRGRDEMRRLIDAANRAIGRVNIEAPTDRQQRRPLDVGVELARFERAARGEPPG
jgi:DnaJ-like protein